MISAALQRFSNAIFLVNENYLKVFERVRDELLVVVERDLEKQRSWIKSTLTPQHQVGGGRGGVVRLEFDGTLKGILRPYLRGGLIGKMQSRSFFRLPFSTVTKLRPMREVSILIHLINNNIPVAAPIVGGAVLLPGGLWYQGFLVTEEIQESENLLYLGYELKKNPERKTDFVMACYEAARCAQKMLTACVFHPDLHLGNVLWKGRKQAYLIDFDKARMFRSPPCYKHYLKQTIKRWQRSAKKHGLESLAVDPFVRGMETL